MAFYNELLLEGFAVLGQGAPVTLNSTAQTVPSTTTGINITSMSRIVWDVSLGAGAGTLTPTVQCCNATNGTYVDITSATTNTTQPMFWQAVSGLTGGFYRFEWDEEHFGAAVANLTIAGATGGPWFRFILTATASNILVASTVYGTATRYPSADVQQNPFCSTANTPVSPVANQYINGSLVNAVPGTVTARYPLILPF